MRSVGIAVAGFGIGLALRSAGLLLGRGRPRRGPRPAFVLAGPYLRIRNPLLGGMIVALGGVSLAKPSLWLGLATALAGLAAHLWVVRLEEPRLRARFGEAYATYLGVVPRWLPRLRRR